MAGLYRDERLPNIRCQIDKKALPMSAPVSPPSGTDKNNENKSGLRFGPLRFTPGVSGKHLATLFFASFFGIASMSFINFSQPYVFTELMGIPLEQQGTVAGRLTFLQEIVLLVLLAPIGALSDKFGRKPLYVSAFVLLALAYFVYPLAGSLFMLFMFRMIFAAGAAGNIVMLPSVANDYSQEQCRAKMIAACFIFNGLGLVLILAVLRNVPARLQEAGIDAAQAGQYWLWMMSGICLVVAAVIAIGLKPGAPQQLGKREPLLATFKIGLKAARNPRIALAYAAAGVSRGDLSVMSSFFSLWLFQVGMDQGLSSAEAQAKAGAFYIIVQAFALPGAPLAGFILDRIDRVKGLTVAMGIAAIGYFSLWVVDDPIGPEMYVAAGLVGLGEIFANLSATSLIGKEAPERGRGAVLGMWSWCGALGIIVVALVGGYLFDNVSQVGPFLFVGAANLALLVWAAIIIARARSANAAEPAD